MKKFLLATTALAATAGFASAQDSPPQGILVTGTASMGVLGGDWIADTDNGTDGFADNADDRIIPGQTDYELHTDIDVTFSMAGQTDTGLFFGAQIDLDESDGFGSGDDARGNSLAFENREEGGETIFVAGPFGVLTMGDTDGALDWALQEIGIGGSLGDAHVEHLGYSSPNFADYEDGSGQIARYEYSFGDFAVALSADIADSGGEDILSAGASYLADLGGTRLGVGLGYQQRGHDGKENDAVGVSLTAAMENGFLAVLNWVDMGDSAVTLSSRNRDDPVVGNGVSEQFVGIGLGYRMDDWLFSANYGSITENGMAPRGMIDRGQDGYGIAVNYNLGGGAQVQLGYSNSSCKKATDTTNVDNDRGGPVTSSNPNAVYACGVHDDEYSTFSLGVAMSF